MGSPREKPNTLSPLLPYSFLFSGVSSAGGGSSQPRFKQKVLHFSASGPDDCSNLPDDDAPSGSRYFTRGEVKSINT